ncbi:LysM peptidoglycan-binding domain-containing protein [Streptomyces daghestanicus]|uniref:Peptidoglycan-binding protein LysM n=1 Tax=Streptomyces daghestanicus TaxID=66885 RepID=A0ABQ3Q912_9ACTN|nr:transglycosylase family protein [Streptomyces daghestanicus]GGU18188.1 peptidoglycan-binding protein LysM [Streptomyces daghestanicus]GHI33752.1 peptidoglycan-binding protein LysM [Streptomyces daghestanicus]
MLSGNGRHRRPRQAPALVVAAGVTGSAIAIPLLGATGAHAADGTTWDRVAECETGGAWSQNSGNGYYGGLQLTQDDWEAYGGLAYASSADQASRAQQIRVAEKVLAAKGVSTWPTCGLLSGLDGGSPDAGASDDASGTTAESGAGSTAKPDSESKPDDSSASSGSSDSSAPSEESAGAKASKGSPSPTPSGGATDDTSSDDSDETPKSDTSSDSPSSPASGAASGDPGDAATTERDGSGNVEPRPATSHLTETVGPDASGAGRHRRTAADGEAADGRSAASSGRHASRGEGDTRDAADGTYTVRTGDSLWAIADSLELDGGWHSLYAGNKATVGADPDHILPGQKLAVAVEPVEK